MSTVGVYDALLGVEAVGVTRKESRAVTVEHLTQVSRQELNMHVRITFCLSAKTELPLRFRTCAL